jgi:hypothetical protein
MLYKPPTACSIATSRSFVNSILHASQQGPRKFLYNRRNSPFHNFRKFRYKSPRMAEDVPTGSEPFPNPISGTTNEASWKHRPPYKIQSDEEFGPVKWVGKCQCGQVEYKLNRERPLKSKYCHCRGCQVLHGARVKFGEFHHNILTDQYRRPIPMGYCFP